MSASDYLVGLVFFGGTVGGAAVIASLIWRRYFRPSRGLVGALSWSTLFFTALTVTHLIPGAAGLLTRGWVLVATLGLVGAAAFVTRAAPGAGPLAPELDGPSQPARDRLAVLALPLLVAVAVAGWAVVLLWQRRTTLASPPFSFDMLTFDFPLIARWIQAHSLWVAHDLVALTSHSAYPQNGDLVYLAVILPWRNAFLAPIVTYPIWALGALAILATAVEIGARLWAATVIAAAFAATPLVLVTAAVDNLPDVFMWAMFACGVLFLVRHLRTRDRGQLVLAGIALGLSFGSTWYGLTCVPLVAAMWVLASMAAGRGRRLWSEAALLVGLVVAAGGFWLVRNIVEYGDPVFPHQVRVFGLTLFSAPVDTYGRAFGFTVAHYIGQWGVWRHYLVPEYKAALRLGGVLLLGGTVVATAVASGRARVRRVGHTALWLGLASVAIVLVYLVTPQTAVGPEGRPLLAGINARYAVPGLLVGAAVSAWALSLVGPVRGPGGTTRRLVVTLVFVAQLAGAASVADAYRSPLRVSTPRIAAVGIVLLVAAYAVGRLRRGSVLRGLSSRHLLAAMTAIVLAGAAASGYALQRRFTSQGLRGRDPVVDWVLAHAPSHARIGMTGSWSTDTAPVLALFGPRLDNRVLYVGRIDRGLVEHYGTYGAWIAAVRADRLNLLVVGRQPQPLETDTEALWAGKAGFPALVTSPHFILYRPT